MKTDTARKIAFAAGAAGLALTGCTKPSAEETLMSEIIEEHKLTPATREEKEAIKDEDLITQSAFWGRQHELSPNDKEAALNFARTLRSIGSTRRSTEVAAQALSIHPADPELTTVFAKAAMDQGRPDVASNALFQAININDAADWKILSLYGVSLDQMGEHQLAQDQYDRALISSPDNSTLFANKALSLAMQGRADEAEKLLRIAVDIDEDVDPRVRQNLAMILGIQGKFDEARSLTSQDLPPTLVAANLDYYRSLLNPSRNWGELRGSQDGGSIQQN